MLAVITSPRSGSSYFCRALNKNGAGRIEEYLNFDNQNFYRLWESKTPQEYWRYIIQQGGLKLFRENLIVIQSELKKSWPTVLFRNCQRIIYLHREDVIERSISQFIACRTRVWQVHTDEDEARQRQKSDAIEYNFSEIYSHYIANLADDAFWSRTLPPVNGPRFKRVRYDAFVDHPDKVLSDVVRWLGHDTSQLDLPDNIRPAAPKRRDLRERFEGDLQHFYGHSGVDCPSEFLHICRDERSFRSSERIP